MNKIHDIDWSYANENSLTTCSHDATVKFWDTKSPRDPHSTIKAGNHPIWRARNCVSFNDTKNRLITPCTSISKYC